MGKILEKISKKKRKPSPLPSVNTTNGKENGNGYDAYIYGYPLVMTGVTEQQSLNSVPTPSSGSAPLNQFGKQTEFPSSEFTAVVLPSTSTLYTSGFLNLKPEPIILHLPDFGDRFFQMPILDGWTNVNAGSPGTRHGSQEGDYVLVGPDDDRDYSGEGRVVIQLDTNTAWIIGRVFTSGTYQDLTYIKDNLYPELTLTPWSKRNKKNYKPPTTLAFDPFVSTSMSPIDQVNQMNAATFFGKLAAMMNYNTALLPQDNGMIKKLKAIGFSFENEITNEYEVTFEYGKLSEKDELKFKDEPLKAKLQIEANKAQLDKEAAKARLKVNTPPISDNEATNNWIFPTEVSLADFGDDYDSRAQVARWAFGANPVPDVVYGYAKGPSLDGRFNYTLHFDILPVVNKKAFWSVTIYNSDGTLVTNQAAKSAGVEYSAIGMPSVQDHNVASNKDGSLTLYLQSKPPRKSKEFQNWLPIPSEPDSSGTRRFIVFLRMYIPDLLTNPRTGEYVYVKNADGFDCYVVKPLDKNGKGWVPPKIVRNTRK